MSDSEGVDTRLQRTPLPVSNVVKTYDEPRSYECGVKRVSREKARDKAVPGHQLDFASELCHDERQDEL